MGEEKSMICPNCGEPLAEGFTYCVACGTDANSVTKTDESREYDVNAAVFSNLENSYSSISSVPAKKKTSVSSIIIYVAIAVIVGMVACYFTGVPYWGKYNLDSMERDGVSFDFSSLDALGYDMDISLTLKPGKAVLSLDSPDYDSYEEEYKVSYRGSKMIFKESDIEFEVRCKHKKITIEFNGSEMTFKK